MCGIAGLAGFEDQELGLAKVQAMVDSLRRRGPDDAGLESFSSCVLGHRRLAIFDLSAAGHQPMYTNDRRTAVVYNGAIYNFRALREQLEHAGWRFQSQTDTEVLLAGFRHWGIHGLAIRLRGMFAFGLWDDPSRTLYLARDRLGIKPLLYANTPGGWLAFASTIRALRGAGLGGDLRPLAMASVLQVGYVPDSMSILEGVEKVPPGHILTWRPQGVTIVPYVTEEVTNSSVNTFDEAVEQTEALLLDAVRLRLEADVPVACLLSSGIDSTLICWAASRINPGVQAFTVATPGDVADESTEASRTAKLLGLDHRVITIGEDHESPPAERLAAAFPEPFPCSSALGLLQVCETVRRHATVLLTGDGGDEAFLGYPEFVTFRLAERLGAILPGGPVRRVLSATARRQVSSKHLLRRPFRLIDYAINGLTAVERARTGRWEEVWAAVAGPRLHDLALEGGVGRVSGVPFIRSYAAYQRRSEFVGEYLPKVDGASMYFGLEARSPFLDQAVREGAGSIPTSVHLKGYTPKAILREIVKRRVHPSIARRPKQGFTIPAERWLTTRWASARTLLTESRLADAGWLDLSGLRAAVSAASRNGVSPLLLWHAAVLEAWARHENIV